LVACFITFPNIAVPLFPLVGENFSERSVVFRVRAFLGHVRAPTKILKKARACFRVRHPNKIFFSPFPDVCTVDRQCTEETSGRRTLPFFFPPRRSRPFSYFWRAFFFFLASARCSLPERIVGSQKLLKGTFLSQRNFAVLTLAPLSGVQLVAKVVFFFVKMLPVLAESTFHSRGTE